MNTKNVTVNDLVRYLPQSTIDKIAKEANVDYQVKKLEGKDVFYLLLFSNLNTKDISLRQTEVLSQSKIYQIFAGKTSDYVVPHTTLSDRLSNINVEFFESIYSTYLVHLQSLYTPEQFKARRIVRFDSTFVGLTSKLLKIGMHNGRKPEKDKPVKNQIKFTVGFDGLFPCRSKVYKEQKDIADDLSFVEIIKSSSLSSKDVAVFDRGLKKRLSYQEFWENEIYFVSRINPTSKYKEISNIPFSQNNYHDTDRLILKKDTSVYLYDKSGVQCKVPIRLIIYTSKETGEDLYFVTNIYDLKASDISEIYSMRWDIEVFFKFIKQELNFKHFLSRSENGIKVTLYITLIIAMMLLIYKRMNKLDGYKLVKTKFYLELQTEIIKIIIKLCGGDANMLDKLPQFKGFGQ